MIESRLTGFSELADLLRLLPKNVEKKVSTQAVMAAMRAAREDVRAAAPVHADEQSQPSKEYGTLKKNIRVVRLKKARGSQKGARIDTGKAYWGHFYELGTRYQPARPWFLPAFSKAKDKVLAVLAQSLGEGIERVANEEK